jgi:hypothetical protein
MFGGSKDEVRRRKRSFEETYARYSSHSHPAFCVAPMASAQQIDVFDLTLESVQVTWPQTPYSFNGYRITDIKATPDGDL